MKLGSPGLRYAMMLLGGCLLSMMTSFAVIRLLTQDKTMVAKVDRHTFESANQLRVWSNEMLDLTRAYLTHVPSEGQGSSTAARTWLSREIRPRLSRLRQQLDETRLDQAPYTVLLAALGRFESLLAHPEDGALRRMALAEVYRAAHSVEAYLSSLGLQDRVPAARRNLDFIEPHR